MGTEPEPAASKGHRDEEDQLMTDPAAAAEASVTALLRSVPSEFMPADVRSRLAKVIADEARGRASGDAFHQRTTPTHGHLLEQDPADPVSSPEVILAVSADSPDDETID